LGKIAVTLQQALARREREGARGGVASHALAEGAGWNIADLLCTFGPHDPSFEERHDGVCIAMVVAGSFDYRAAPGRELLTPGALLLGNTGECFECGHRHDAGLAGGPLNFRRASVPALRRLAPLIARACAATSVAGGEGGKGSDSTACSESSDNSERTSNGTSAARSAWGELAVEVAVATLHAAGTLIRAPSPASATARSRVAQIARLIDDTPGAPHTLTDLANAAGVSDFYFLRTFRQVTGVTPHQYLLRARLRAAALRLRDGGEKIVDIALDCGFNDLSNFNHAFRAEFAASPRAWRARGGALRL